MSAIDVEQLLQEIGPDDPCGPDLEYDAAFLELSREAQGKPAQEMGGQVIAAEEPDWRDVRSRALDLLARSKDLRVATILARALLHTEGLPGFADGVTLLRGLVERHWQGVHPKLDPDDSNDPAMRVNTLLALADRDQTLNALRAIALADSRRVGRYNLRDHEIATGALPRPEEGGADIASVDAAFLDMDVAQLQATADAAGRSLEQIQALESSLDSHAGSASADFTPVRATLKAMNHLLTTQLARRGVGDGAVSESGESVGGSEAGGGNVQAIGGIRTREDVVRVLDQVCDWYQRTEPSSPVPLLLQRAKRLVTKNFVELMQDLSPGGMSEIRTIAGLDSDS